MIPIDEERLQSTCLFVGRWLDRLAKEQGQPVATEAAAHNIHANVAYLRQAAGDVEALEFLGGLIEKVTADAMTKARGNG